jgi:hypothetical protein
VRCSEELPRVRWLAPSAPKEHTDPADTTHHQLLVILKIDGSGGAPDRVLHRLYSAESD